MTEIHDVLYPPKENDTSISHRRYDAKERLVAWSVRQDDHFLLFRVDAFREVTLESGEKLDVPETIQCRFSERDTEVSVVSEAFPWAGRELDAETELRYNSARWYDPTPGRWISEEPLGHEPGNDGFVRYTPRAVK